MNREELKQAMEAAEKIAILYSDSDNLEAAENAVNAARKAREEYNAATDEDKASTCYCRKSCVTIPGCESCK